MPVTEVPAEPPVPFQVDPEPTAELDPPSFLICVIESEAEASASESV